LGLASHVETRHAGQHGRTLAAHSISHFRHVTRLTPGLRA
jgi:hypothetical protein